MLKTKEGILELIPTGIIILCTLAIFVAILINFLESKNSKKVKKEKKSIVETGTMTLFFVIFYFVIKFHVGVLNIGFDLYLPALMLGLVLILVGCFVNISGRFALKDNWANQIKLYEGQTIVKTGVYGIVRHPLYSSLIWMFYGASLCYLNYTAFLLNTFIFIPFMYHRARQEEKMLEENFKAYKKYKQEVGMFFPRIKV
jgi:protein-S-isoprenylcysteine O-methyltransferase Ste14